MVEISHKERFLRIKILYYGPAAGGKTTTLQSLHRFALKDRRQELVSVNTAQDRTILFDLLPLSTPAFRSYDIRFQVVAVPGQKLYGATRKMLLKNADSIVFVSNSATDRWQENLQSLKEMTENLLDHGIEPSSLPLIFQYNKRDLPDVVDLKIMERSLNARGAPSFPTVATEGQGVLEAFAAALERTMTELATRYKIGEKLGDPRSAKDWVATTMKETFGVTPAELKSKAMNAPPSEDESRELASATRVFRVTTPSLSRPAAPGPASPPPSLSDAASAGVVSPPPSLGASPEPNAGATLPPPSSPPPATPPAAGEMLPSAATEIQDPRAAQAMVESYAEAASSLADHISELRAESELVQRRVSSFTEVVSNARQLFRCPPDDIPKVLDTIVEHVASALQCKQASLSLIRPDGKLEQVVGLSLVVDPLDGAKTPGGRPLANAIIEGRKAMIQVRGDSGPLGEAIDRAGPDCVAVVALPMVTPVHSIGLLTFYLPQEAPAPNPSDLDHLSDVVSELTMALEVISDATAAQLLKQVLKTSFRGRVVEGAAQQMASPLSGIQSALGRLRAQPDQPPWLEQELGQIENCSSTIGLMRNVVMGLRAGQLPAVVPTPVAELLASLEKELTPALSEQGIQFVLELKPGVKPVLAEPFLLRGMFYSLVETSRRRLLGTEGGIIRILAESERGNVRLSFFDNLIAVSNAQSHPSRYLTWPLERRLTVTTLEVIGGIVEYFQGQWSEETREAVGTVRTIILPIA